MPRSAHIPTRFAWPLLAIVGALAACSVDGGGEAATSNATPDAGATTADGGAMSANDASTSTSDATAPDGAVKSEAAAPPDARAQVLAFIAGISGSKTIAGQHDKYNATPSDATDWITSHTGKTPALWSADFGFGTDALANRGRMIAEAKAEWHKGAIVQLMYHNCIPTRDELCGWDDIGGANPQHLSDAQWTELVTDGTALNLAWKKRLDALSVFFADLKAAGIAPLFRPLHEMNQGVFWWGGRKGAMGTRRLFQITHDYLVGTKGFDHIIWVWDIQDFDTLATDAHDYDPGAAYYDIAALDVYGGGYDRAKYDVMLGVAGAKPIAIGECQHPPTSALLAQQPKWAFFMLWPDFLDENAAMLPALYAAPNVITEAQMPGWR